MFLQYILLLFLLSAGCFGYVVNTDSSKGSDGGWENVFAHNKSSVIPLYFYGGKSYFMAVHAEATYMQALEFCENIHMKLLSVRSAEENDRIYKYIRNTNKGTEYWTSASKLLDGKTWIWMSYGDFVEYTNWVPGLSQDDAALCLQLESRDQTVYWKNRYCTTTMLFICERYIDTENNSNRNEIGKSEGQVTIQTQTVSSITDSLQNIITVQNRDSIKVQPENILNQTETNYMQAMQFCKLIKMELVTITSQKENDRIHKYIRDIGGDEYWWTSGTKILDGKTWLWLSRGTEVDYTNWLPGQPDGDTQYCLQLIHNRDLYWNDNHCSNKYSIICERSSTDPIDGNGNGYGNGYATTTTTTVAPTSTPKIGGRLPTDEDDYFNSKNMRKIKSGLITHSYVEGKKYHMEVDHVGTQWQAIRFCEYHNMQLVAIRDKKESELIRRLLTDSSVSGPYWTSGKKRSRTWVWTISGEQMSFVNWNKNKPSDAGYDKSCIEVDENAKWSDQSCAEKRYFICEEP